MKNRLYLVCGILLVAAVGRNHILWLRLTRSGLSSVTEWKRRFQ